MDQWRLGIQKDNVFKRKSTPEEQGEMCDSSTLLKQINTEKSEKLAIFAREPGPAS